MALDRFFGRFRSKEQEGLGTQHRRELFGDTKRDAKRGSYFGENLTGRSGGEAEILMRTSEAHLPQDAASVELFTVWVDGEQIDIPLFAIADGVSMMDYKTVAVDSGTASRVAVYSAIESFRYSLQQSQNILPMLFPGRQIQVEDEEGVRKELAIYSEDESEDPTYEAGGQLALDAAEYAALRLDVVANNHKEKTGHDFLGQTTLQMGLVIPHPDARGSSRIMVYTIGSANDTGLLYLGQTNGSEVSSVIPPGEQGGVFLMHGMGNHSMADYLRENVLTVTGTVCAVTSDGIKGDRNGETDAQERVQLGSDVGSAARALRRKAQLGGNKDDITAVILKAPRLK
ncbi:MAG: hypothetical protein TR69_WS6001001359 [candidate division WS6 bacterium OLB20]|uniref:PPM-type phosphatase domain-containing protein n=1 Tax=candidate division WS6 bacterium OLB20 TaxID=1617426 RepID=A0A136LWN9_9BACT|nr:MAG: hypothetical protein TR69_WS6001001359 [candidate division WS6 bacterium OLB20]